MKKITLKKPNLLQLTIGLFISISQSIFTKRNILVPQNVEKYNLISEVKKQIADKEYGVGIYEHKGKKVFIKTWKGKIKDFRYYSLTNEYRVNKVLYKKTHKASRSKYLIKIPQVVDCVENKDSLSIVFEYVQGKTLTSFSLEQQTEIISAIITALYSMSDLLTDKEKSQFAGRTFSFYFFSLPLFTLLTIASNIGSWKVLIRALIDCFRTLKHIDAKKLYLTHRDLDIHNILVNKSGVYIVDCERMIFTVPNYDISAMSLDPHLKRLAKLVCKQLRQTPNEFLKNYISIQLAKSFGNPQGLQNFYMKGLYKKYA